MKKNLLIFFLFPLITLSQTNDCNNLSNFGDISICLPNLEDMTECYYDPLVKLTADMFKGTDEEEIIGIYLLDDIYESRYENYFEEGMGDSFIKIYSTSIIKGQKVNEEDLDYLTPYIKEAFDDFEKSEIKSKINDLFNGFDMSISFDKPILLDEYQISPKIRSFVVLFKYALEDEAYIQIATMNAMIIKERIIFFAYYEKYKDFSQIDKIKAFSDYFALRLFEKN